MSYPLNMERPALADHCEQMFIDALAQGRDAFATYWARQEIAALYPDGRRGGRGCS